MLITASPVEMIFVENTVLEVVLKSVIVLPSLVASKELPESFSITSRIP